jgi:hypothetical protein
LLLKLPEVFNPFMDPSKAPITPKKISIPTSHQSPIQSKKRSISPGKSPSQPKKGDLKTIGRAPNLNVITTEEIEELVLYTDLSKVIHKDL